MVKRYWFEYLATNRINSINLNDVRQGFIYSSSEKRAEKKMLKSFKRVLIIRKVKT